MARYLITGRSGTGKSEIYRELLSRNINAFDGDKVKGLVGWRDPITHEKIQVDYSKPITPAIALWNWDRTVLEALLKENDDMFLCGSADNQLEFHDLFDTVFVLTLSPELQMQRIQSRTEHDYGKSPEMQKFITKDQSEFVKQATALGAVKINAEPLVSVVVDSILEFIHG